MVTQNVTKNGFPFEVGDLVEVVNIEDAFTDHPTEDRHVKNGDQLRIAEITIGSDGHTEFMAFKIGSVAIYPWRVNMISAVNSRTKQEEQKECKCETLLHGHHHGCFYYKERT